MCKYGHKFYNRMLHKKKLQNLFVDVCIWFDFFCFQEKGKVCRNRWNKYIKDVFIVLYTDRQKTLITSLQQHSLKSTVLAHQIKHLMSDTCNYTYIDLYIFFLRVNLLFQKEEKCVLLNNMLKDASVISFIIVPSVLIN